MSGQFGPQVVSTETATVLQAALDLATETQGAFDPTVGPLMELWGFRGTQRTRLPTETEIAAAQSKVGHNKIQMGRASDQWRVDAAGTVIDLGAIKGTGWIGSLRRFSSKIEYTTWWKLVGKCVCLARDR